MRCLLSAFIAALAISTEHLQHLLQDRMLTPEYVGGRFATADAARVQDVLFDLKEDGYTKAEMRAVGLVNAEGRPHSYLVDDGILIAYIGEDGRPFHIRAHKLGPPGAPLEVYGRECLADRPTRVVITEGEYKAAALICRGFPALAVPGVASFAGRRYDDLLALLRGAEVKEVTISFDNEDKTNPVLPSGETNERYKTDPFKRHDTELWAIVMARRLSGDGIPTKIAGLPDEWRDDTGKADLDGVLNQGRTIEELKAVLDSGLDPEAFLAGLSAEAQEVVPHKLCEGRPRWTRDGLRLRKGQLDILAVPSPRSKKMTVTISDNYRPVFTDELNLASHRARATFVTDASVKVHGQGEDIEQMVEQLSLAVSQGGEHREPPTDGEVVEIGSQRAVVKPEGISLLGNSGERQVSNFRLEFLRDKVVHDGIEDRREVHGVVIVDGARHPVTIRGASLGSPMDLSRALHEQVGTVINYFSGVGVASESIVLQVALASSRPVQCRIDKVVGWDADGCYRTPDECFDADGPRHLAGVEVSLAGERIAENIRMAWIEDAELQDLGRHMVTDFLDQHDRSVTMPTLGHAFLAPLLSRLHLVGRPALMLRGDTGTRKTSVARTAQCLFGAGFIGEHSIETWVSTANSIPRAGFFFRDCLFLVDDFKLDNITNLRAARSVIQTYADGNARQRLRRDALGYTASYPIRGALLMTGEDAPFGSASVMARIITVAVGYHDGLEAGSRCLARCGEYNGLMARYISWIARVFDDADLRHELRVVTSELFDGKIPDVPNRPRIVSNLSLNALGFQLFLLFLIEHDVITDVELDELWAQYVEIAGRLALTTAGIVKEQRAVQIFMDTLRDRIAAGRLVFTSKPGQQPEHGGQVIGFEDGPEHVLLIMSEAYSAVEQHLQRQKQSIGLTQPSLTDDLKTEGVIEAAGQKPHAGGRPRVWRVERAVLGMDPPQASRVHVLVQEAFRSKHSGAKGG
jgi:hypothetical protein